MGDGRIRPDICGDGDRGHRQETALNAVEAAGGVITRPIFAFPGGRRFHFRDPSGNELAAVKGEDSAVEKTTR